MPTPLERLTKRARRMARQHRQQADALHTGAGVEGILKAEVLRAEANVLDALVVIPEACCLTCTFWTVHGVRKACSNPQSPTLGLHTPGDFGCRLHPRIVHAALRTEES